ncbi:MAG: 2Fe-2S iron-sulfur cluster-binding protein [Elusimicrobiota bacterium]
MHKINIDGQTVEVEPHRQSSTEKTILEVAKSAGIYIPTLCYHPALEPYGACRLCLVEITKPEWKEWSKLVVSCAYHVENNLIVKTSSEKVIKARKFILELLLARVPESDVIQKLANQYGITKTRFSSSLNPEPPTLNCILCGLCVRVCDEIIGENAICFAYRGANREVMAPFNKPSEVCLTCGACAFVCPMGAIKIEDIVDIRKISISKTEASLVRCKNCGVTFTALPVSEKVKKKFQTLQELLELCQKCRRKKTIEKLSYGPMAIRNI